MIIIKNNQNNFFEKVKNKGFDRIYDYSKAKYVNNKTKIEIKCLKKEDYFFNLPFLF